MMYIDRCGQTWRVRQTVMLVLETERYSTPGTQWHRVLVLTPTDHSLHQLDKFFEDGAEPWETIPTWTRLG